MKKIGLLSDTHGYIDERVFEHFKDCDEIWHAGDIGGMETADKLASFKPMRGVYGNIDDHKVRLTFPLINRFMCEDVDVFMTHIGGYPGHYNYEIKPKLLAKPPKLFISGHSHIFKVMPDKKLNLLHINPGAAGFYGFHVVRTLIRFVIDKNNITNLEVIELGPRSIKVTVGG
jgi:uncharacterized protein